MTDASLPDRVEAADPRRAAFAKVYEDFDSIEEVMEPYQREILTDRLLAAADACEAERNPNTPDEYEQVGWLCEGVLYDEKPTENEAAAWYAYSGSLADDDCLWEPVFVRRPVSSEDVHREAAE